MTDGEREQTKLLANALNTAATSCFIIGVATPLAGYVYNVGAMRTAVEPLILVAAPVAWLGAAVALPLIGRYIIKGLDR